MRVLWREPIQETEQFGQEYKTLLCPGHQEKVQGIIRPTVDKRKKGDLG